MVKEISLEPNWERTAAWHANALRTHSFDFGATEPIVSFIQQIRYLTQLDMKEGKTLAHDGRINTLLRRIGHG